MLLSAAPQTQAGAGHFDVGTGSMTWRYESGKRSALPHAAAQSRLQASS